MSNKPLTELSLFLPCYNEEKNLQHTFNQIQPIIEQVADQWEIIIINDGSKDNTGKIAQKIAIKYPKNVKIITHPQNRGYGAAFKSGLYGAKYQWIALTDADGQFDFNDIYELIKAQKNSHADLVIGYYLGRKVPVYRILSCLVYGLPTLIVALS